jgi:hypothetical protein
MPMSLDTEIEFHNYRDNELRPIFQPFGRPVPEPLNGETLSMFQRRAMNTAKQLSPDFKDVDIVNTNDSVFKLISKQIVDSVKREITNPTNVPPGELKQVIEYDAAGRPSYKFFGSPSSWMNQFTNGTRKRLIGIRTENIDGYNAKPTYTKV